MLTEIQCNPSRKLLRGAQGCSNPNGAQISGSGIFAITRVSRRSQDILKALRNGPEVGFWEIEYSLDGIWEHCPRRVHTGIGQMLEVISTRRVHVKKFLRS